MSSTKLGIKIDYDRNVENSSRVFHAMGDMIDGVNEVHRKRPGNYTYLLTLQGNRLSISGAGWHSSLRQAMM